MERLSKSKIVELLAVTNEVCGGAQLSDLAVEMMAVDLEKFPAEQLNGAFTRCSRECKGRVALKDIVQRIDDGRPSAEEAWTMLPRSEDESAMLTDEMRDVLYNNPALTEISDKWAARQAFTTAYNDACAEARNNVLPVSWMFSAGGDRNGRVECLRKALAKGLVTEKYVRAMAPEALEGENSRPPSLQQMAAKMLKAKQSEHGKS